MTTSDAVGVLRLLQLVSPALPVGAFSYSEGLEVLVQAGSLASPEALRAWLEAELQWGSVTLEAAALAHFAAAMAAAKWGAVADLDGWLLAQREAPEVRAQQRQMGHSLVQLLTDLGCGLPAALPAPLAWPAAFAWAGVGLELASPHLEQGYLYGWTANQISAAVRLVPLGPTQGQRLQLALAPLIAAQAETLAQADPRRLWSSGVGASLAQLQHAELYSRLFRS